MAKMTRNKNKIKTKTKDKKLGTFIISPTGLRRMANALQKKHKTKDDIKVKCHVAEWNGKKTLGIQI